MKSLSVLQVFIQQLGLKVSLARDDKGKALVKQPDPERPLRSLN
jgi:hypothetical protein